MLLTGTAALFAIRNIRGQAAPLLEPRLWFD